MVLENLSRLNALSEDGGPPLPAEFPFHHPPVECQQGLSSRAQRNDPYGHFLQVPHHDELERACETVVSLRLGWQWDISHVRLLINVQACRHRADIIVREIDAWDEVKNNSQTGLTHGDLWPPGSGMHFEHDNNQALALVPDKNRSKTSKQCL